MLRNFPQLKMQQLCSAEMLNLRRDKLNSQFIVTVLILFLIFSKNFNFQNLLSLATPHSIRHYRRVGGTIHKNNMRPCVDLPNSWYLSATIARVMNVCSLVPRPSRFLNPCHPLVSCIGRAWGMVRSNCSMVYFVSYFLHSLVCGFLCE